MIAWSRTRSSRPASPALAYASLVDDPFEAGIWEAPVDSWREDGYPVDEFIVIIEAICG